MKPTSRLHGDEVTRIQALLAKHPTLSLDFDGALTALADGPDNRSALLGAAGRGVALGIDFDTLTVRTTYGDLSEAEIRTATATPRRAELHIQDRHLPAARAALANRFTAVHTLRDYRLDLDGRTFAPDPRCRRLTSSDGREVAGLFQHYGDTIFSTWMLDQPFFGLFEGGHLLAAGGVVVQSRRLRSANLGNFLTRPDRRGRGLARAVVRTLAATLRAEGCSVVTLSTYAANEAACRAYEAVGFELFDSRLQVNVRAAEPV
ncbi:MAG TPA: GNAT family N-acetyltransferase [Azospirillaceae bacterium]|nr:GNAT family N-acetyltransferase [Azospirillaceae bacterium]